MDDIWNILYFVIAIIVFIVSAIRKGKKGTEKSGNQAASSIESLFGLTEEEPISEYKNAAPQVEPISESFEPQVQAFEKITEQEGNNEGVSSIPDEIKLNEISNEEATEVEFDLRSAIIYKEILNRKNF